MGPSPLLNLLCQKFNCEESMNIVTLMHSYFGWIKFMSSVGLSDYGCTHFRSIIKCVIIYSIYKVFLCEVGCFKYLCVAGEATLPFGALTWTDDIYMWR